MRTYSGWAHFLPKSYTVLRQGYSAKFLANDCIAGLTVGVVAFPLAMAFAMASGVGPERGLFTAIVAGVLVSALGGSRYQISGPTGVFVVVLYGIVQRHGYDGLAVATLMAGCMLIVFGLARLGTLIQYIPYPVTTGFTSGIALIVFASQIKDFFGLKIETLPTDFVAMLETYAAHAGTANGSTIAVGAGSLLTIVAARRFAPRIPGPLAAVVLAALAVWALKLPVETIGARFGAISATLPAPAWPALSFARAGELFPDAFTIALLAGIESLLSAVAADGMTGDRHRSNSELLAQGVANVASVLFGGIAATGAIARTAASVKSGAATPLAGMLHAAFLALFLWIFAPLVPLIPLAALAAILFVAAWNMSEIGHFASLLRSPKSDIAVLLATFGLTVLVSLNVAAPVGVVLAALLVMRRRAQVAELRASGLLDGEASQTDGAEDDPEATRRKRIPPDTEVYEIDGPFFFGAADRLKDTLSQLARPAKVFILRMRRVPAVEATGLHALEEFHSKCRRQGTLLVLAGVNAQPLRALHRIGLDVAIGEENIHEDMTGALRRAWGFLVGPRPSRERWSAPRV
jgi:SulP family sulfate permease